MILFAISVLDSSLLLDSAMITLGSFDLCLHGFEGDVPVVVDSFSAVQPSLHRHVGFTSSLEV